MCGCLEELHRGWSPMPSSDNRRTPKAAAGRSVKDAAGQSTSATPKAPRPTEQPARQGNILTNLPAAHDGRADPANAAVGDKPVFAYINSLPEPQHSIAERVDALAAKTLPGLQRSVKWGIAWYGVGDGWCFSCGGFAGHVKLTFGRGTALAPVPPMTPIGMGKDSRGVDLKSVDDLDEGQLAVMDAAGCGPSGFGKR